MTREQVDALIAYVGTVAWVAASREAGRQEPRETLPAAERALRDALEDRDDTEFHESLVNDLPVQP